MIQELLGGAGLIGGERKISIPTVLEASPCPSPSPSPSPSSSTTTTTPATSSENQNLRCPRCDSTNTKFCYYNNYNLTQPRHFCKTCRRYWTKGGALRNVPIGGGCRKNKSVTFSTPLSKSCAGRLKTLVSPEIGKPGLNIGGFGQELPSNPILWATEQNCNLLSLLRSTQNPNPSPNSVTVKEESVMTGTHFPSEPTVTTGALNGRILGAFDSFWRNNNQSQAQQTDLVLGEVQNSGVHELYQRLKSAANYYPDHNLPILLSNVASSPSTILESAPVSAGDQVGYWNPTLSWSDLPTTNGTYP